MSAIYTKVDAWASSAASGSYNATAVAEQLDVDLDGETEFLLYNDRVFGLFERLGGRLVAAWVRDLGTGAVFQGLGNPLSAAGGETEEEGNANLDGTGAGAYRTSGFKDWFAQTGAAGVGNSNYVNDLFTVTQSGSGWKFTSSDGKIVKTISLGVQASRFEANYVLSGGINQLAVRFGLSPNLDDLLLYGQQHLSTLDDATRGEISALNASSGAAVRTYVKYAGAAGYNATYNRSATDRAANSGFTTFNMRNQAQTQQVEIQGGSGLTFSLGLETGSTISVDISTANDGIPDSWKRQYGLSITDPNVAAADGDGDGKSNLAEYLLGTDPTVSDATFRPWSVFHANNRVISGNNVQFWAKVGYIGKSGALNTRWADHGVVYFTLDGTDPAGALGIPSNGSTQVLPMNLDHVEDDPSAAGNTMWWTGSSAMPSLTTIKYRIGFWHSSAKDEKFADYNQGTANTVFTFSLGSASNVPSLSINGVGGDYTTTHVFVDELANQSVPINVVFAPNVLNVTAAEIFTNLNRRDRAQLDSDNDGIEDGIQPPNGNNLVAGDDSSYYKAYTATPNGDGTYSLALAAQKTGAYRLTARYKVSGSNTWNYFSGDGSTWRGATGGRRDHAIVVSPQKARSIVLYELNTLNVESEGTQDTQRSTFVDLWDGPGSKSYQRFNLDYVKNLGCNWLWFQPIHPIGVNGRQIDPVTGQPFEVGSPYAVKNFFEVDPLMSKANTRPAAMKEFQDFVAAADAQGVSVMLDAPFNHTAYDCELSARGVTDFAPGAAVTDVIRDKEARVYSANNDYNNRASSAGSVAVAPDRGDFGKFTDVDDIYFGRYSALVDKNPDNNGDYLNEADQFAYGDSDWTSADFTLNGQPQNITRNVWKYFADYILFWLDQTGCPAGTPASASFKGIDGLRADFGQGLPPQCWEYIVNKARSRKWDFVFMTESLDGGAVTYRSNRHFDILNENIVFPLKSATTATDYRNIFDQRRTSYGQSLVLMNSTSHDEENYDDPFQALIRHTVTSTNDGAPMIFYGQENGISRTFGFDRYETNFGKQIAHFKKYNSLQPILAPGNRNFGLDQIFPVYAALNRARQESPALQSSNRYFLNQTNGSIHPSIYAVAKYEAANSSPNAHDVVFGFANLDRNNDQSGNFDVSASANSLSLFGIKTGRLYNIKNRAAYLGQDVTRRDQWVWVDGNSLPQPHTGDAILSNGIYVGLHKVPTTDAAWSSAPFEAQYLKLYDVTPPPAPPAAPAPASGKGYVIGDTVTFTWPAATDPDGGISGYEVTVNGTPMTVGNVTSLSVRGSLGQTLTASVRAINGAGIKGSPSAASRGTVLLNPAGDADGDGVSNAAEDLAGTDPLDAKSTLRITSVVRLNATNVTVTWNSVPGVKYVVQATPDLATAYTAASATLTATSSSTTYQDTNAGGAKRFYRVTVVP